MNTELQPARFRRYTLRLAPWLVSVATAVVGLTLLLSRTIIVWDESTYEPETWDANPIDVSGIGLALLCVGILSLMATLLVEAHRIRSPRGDGDTAA